MTVDSFPWLIQVDVAISFIAEVKFQIIGVRLKFVHLLKTPIGFNLYEVKGTSGLILLQY